MLINKSLSLKKTAFCFQPKQDKSKLLHERLPQRYRQEFIDSEHEAVAILEHRNAIYYGHTNRQNKGTGIGIVMFDDGNLMVCNQVQGVVRGSYFFYDSHSMMCFYGNIRNNRLDGINYARSRKSSCLIAHFVDGRIKDGQPVWAYHKGKIDELTGKLMKSSAIRSLANSKRTSPPTASEFVKLSDFIFSTINEPQGVPQMPLLQLYEINQDQLYLGTLKDGKPDSYGVIFDKEWPVCYGFFRQGKLEGLARVEKNSLLVVDGVFEKSTIKMGWVIDFRRQTTSFGMEKKGNLTNKFQIVEEYSKIRNEKVGQFRQKQHMISLLYSNSDRCQPLIKQAWPVNFFEEIRYEPIVSEILQSFTPLCISEISRVADISSNRVQRDLLELIREHEQKKKSYMRVSQILSERLRKYEHEIQTMQEIPEPEKQSLTRVSMSKSRESHASLSRFTKSHISLSKCKDPHAYNYKSKESLYSPKQPKHFLNYLQSPDNQTQIKGSKHILIQDQQQQPNIMTPLEKTTIKRHCSSRARRNLYAKYLNK